MTAPKRIQLSRAKGWRKPEGAIVVSRPSKWGNEFRIALAWDNVHGRMWRVMWPDGRDVDWSFTLASARALAVLMYEPPADVSELRGHDLACWCPLDQACHGDTLLKLANA